VNPFDALGLPPTASAGEVKARWRALRRELHPDLGGDAAAFDAARKAFEKAYELAQRCQVCSGTGKVIINSGLSSLKTRCKACRGTGRTGSD